MADILQQQMTGQIPTGAGTAAPSDAVKAAAAIAVAGVFAGVNINAAQGHAPGANTKGLVPLDQPMLKVSSRDPGKNWVDRLFNNITSHQPGGSPLSEGGGALAASASVTARFEMSDASMAQLASPMPTPSSGSGAGKAPANERVAYVQ